MKESVPKGPDSANCLPVHAGVNGRRVWIRHRWRFTFLKVHLSDFFECASDHQARIGEVEALTEDTRKVQDFGYNHVVVPAGQIIGYVVAQHFF